MKKIYIVFIALCALAQYSYAASNTITIQELDGVTTNNYPIQIARPFKKGEIVNFPQAYIGATPISTQADIKERWEDGTVKHAIITFYIPTLTANSTITVSFKSQSSGNNTGFLNTAAMLSSAFDFDARVELTKGGNTISASAKPMLQNNAYTYWMQGTNATSIILADHSLTRQFDIGFDTARSLRPIFHATFFPLINKVRVRIIGELANTICMQDIIVDNVIMKTGASSPSTRYTLTPSKAPLKMTFASRFTKELWIGGEPSNISINHNLAYLTETMFIPNFDTTKTYTAGLAVPPTDIYDNGYFKQYMPTVGGRSEIGIYPAWDIRWIYRWDKNAKDMCIIHAELGAAWPVHIREGSSVRYGQTRYFDKAKNIPALGKPISLNGRPTFGTFTYINSSAFATVAEDKIIAAGVCSFDPFDTAAVDYLKWYPDVAHTPGLHAIPYMLTGDFYYLEELQFWASYVALSPNPKGASGRGLTGAEGGLFGEIRGEAWAIRDRARSAFLSPDNTPEKNYFTTITNEALARWEGQRNITGTILEGTAEWNHGNTTAGGKFTPSPLNHWDYGVSGNGNSADLDPAKVGSQNSPWMCNFLLCSLGHLKEMGFPSQGLHSWLSKNLIGQLTDSGFDPYYSCAYRMPIIDLATGTYYPDWASTLTGFYPWYNAQTDFNTWLGNPPGDSYVSYALAAASFSYHEPGGADAWNWISSKALAGTNGLPRWAIVPRSLSQMSIGVSEIQSKSENMFSIYPNPTTDKLYVNFSSTVDLNASIKIFNSIGSIVLQRQNVSNEQQMIKLENFTSGIYFIQCINGDHSDIKKFVIE